MTAFLTIILGLLVVIVGLVVAWPWWVWPASLVLLLLFGAVTQKVLTREPDGFPLEYSLEPDFPTPVVHRQEHRVTYVALPSSVPDYDFSFSATVRWVLLDAPDDAPHINPGGLAVDAVLRRAREVTVRQPPTRSALVQHQLDGCLGIMEADPTGRVLAMAQDVTLNLPDPDRERLTKLSNVRKDEDLWEHERNYERNKRAYLGEDVLKDPGSAVVWWLAKNDDQVEGTVDRIGLLASLSAAANNGPVHPEFQHLVDPPTVGPGGDEPLTSVGGLADPFEAGSADGPGPAEPLGPESLDGLLEWLGFDESDPDLLLFAVRLAELVEAHEKPEAAEAIRQHFEPAEPDEPDQPDKPDQATEDNPPA
ncbi:hypothetical protein [Streptomyces liangshanensis]|uniref:Uncharacterized protein n=1 Tax=Streptomyces liangshanensis TaxID=2717324 RepID=A0A6G9H5H7_9ACTN|nr:hypothetical protein [Streptomyces liangshanensis]QIQ05782.1 hypothetical protein HA039_28885 [Streptomyces liangshanensis]